MLTPLVEQVVQLKEELQKRGLPGAGKKDELVTRLASAMELEETQHKVKKIVEKVVGKDVSPYVGMRVRHSAGKDHGSSRGLLGTIEIIPGRGALKPDERSVSVRWDADKSDVRGPYYTGEPCDRGSGIGTEKFDLIALQEVNEEEAEDAAGESSAEQAAAGNEDEADERSAPAEAEGIEVDGLQDEELVEMEAAADAGANQGAALGEALDEGASSPQQRLPSPVTAAAAAADERKLSGSKRNSDGKVKDVDAAAAPGDAVTSVQALQQRLNQCKQAWEQRMSTDPQSPSPAMGFANGASSAVAAPESKKGDAAALQVEADEQARPVRATRNSSAKKAAAVATPAKDAATPAAAASSTKKTRSSKKPIEGMPAAMEPGPSLCSSAKKAAQPVGPSSQPHESVQHFRAIISRINAEKEKSDFSAAAASALPPRASTSRMPSALASCEAVTAAKEEAQASKPITWPPPPLKATGIKLTEGTEPGASRLTEERLSAHIKSEGKHRMLDSYASSPAVSAAANGSRGGVAPEASVDSVNDGSKAAASRSVLDAAARQQRAAENRARMEEEMKKKAADQERRRKELENKRVEAEKIARERRDKEAKEQQERLEAAKRRAQEDEERRVKHIQEQEERKRLERERAEQQEREREAKEQVWRGVANDVSIWCCSLNARGAGMEGCCQWCCMVL